MMQSVFSPFGYLSSRLQETSLDDLVPTDFWGSLFATTFLRFDSTTVEGIQSRLEFLQGLGAGVEEIQAYLFIAPNDFQGLLVGESPINTTLWNPRLRSSLPSLTDFFTKLIRTNQEASPE